MKHRTTFKLEVFPQSWIGRLVAALIAGVLFLLAFFFLAAALVAGAIVAAVVILRIMWLIRKVRRQAAEAVIEGAYSVEPKERLTAGVATDTASKQPGGGASETGWRE
jgi:predicted lipid-binding transport protein (Tim44 family)